MTIADLTFWDAVWWYIAGRSVVFAFKYLLGVVFVLLGWIDDDTRVEW